MILYMLVCGSAPFQEANDSETLTMIMDCNYIVNTIEDETDDNNINNHVSGSISYFQTLPKPHQ